MKKLFILSLCFMFFVQNVEAGVDLFCGHCCEHKRKCLAKKSAVKEKYKNETKQHNNCQEQYNVCQVDRDSYKTWRDRSAIGAVVVAIGAVVGAVVATYKLNEKKNDLILANRIITLLRDQNNAQEAELDIYRRGFDNLVAISHHI